MGGAVQWGMVRDQWDIRRGILAMVPVPMYPT